MAFDRAAAGYDAAFTHTRLGRWLRDAVRERLAAAFGPGDRVLELGCGTGEDALWLARRGVQVTATDASPAMLAVARRKAEAAGVNDRVEFALLDLAEFAPGGPGFSAVGGSLPPSALPGPHPDPLPKGEGVFDGAFSNFGALNCLPDRRLLAGALAQWVRPGGRVLLVVMGPLCPWEVAWHLAHGRPGQAFRRFRAGAPAHVGGGATAPVWYPSPRRLRAEFLAEFRHLETVGIGSLLPPSYLGALVERRPRFFEALARLERRVGALFPWSWLNDHYLVSLSKDTTKPAGSLARTPTPGQSLRRDPAGFISASVLERR